MTEPYDISAVWDDYFRFRSDNFRNRLMEHYLPLVKYTTDRIWERLPDGIFDLDSLLMAGIYGLKHSVETYCPGTETVFESHSKPLIRSSIIAELQSMVQKNRLVKARIYQLSKAKQKLIAELLNTGAAESNRLKKEKLKALIRHNLTRTEKLVMIFYYGEEMTMKEIAAALDTSETEVARMHSTTVARLKSKLAE